jgi:hypothetical protein
MISDFDRQHGRRSKRAHRTATLALRLALGLTCVTAAAYAAEPDAETRTQARELARRGAEAFEQKDYKTALDRFARAETLFRAPSIAVMRARSLVELGRLVEALDAYEATARMPLAGDAPVAFREAVNDAKREAEELRHRVPHLTLHIRADKGIPTGLVVLLDGKAVPEALLDVERPVDPGSHEVRASAPEHVPVTQGARLNERDHLTLDVVLGSDNAAAASPSSTRAIEAVGAASAEQKSGGSSVWGWALVGAGAAGIGVGAITGAIALNKKSSLDAQCRPGCPPSASSELDAFRSNRTLSYVSFAVGAVAFGAGGYILLFTHRSEAGHVAAGVGPGTIEISGAF